MKANELLKPRYEVIADYPFNEHEIGIVLTQELTGCFSFIREGKRFTTTMKNIEKYPHLFRKLNWWEYRTEDEMPKKVKAKEFDQVHTILKWDMQNLIGYVNIEKRSVCDLALFAPEYGYFPVD